MEQLGKQAKDLLEHYRAGHPAAVAEVRQFEHQPDSASFALSDAQRVLARAYGYESWSRLKAFVDGASIARLAEAVNAGDVDRVRALIHARPELVGKEMAADNEHRALHFAVLRRDAAIVRLLMEVGADARVGIYPHRDATSALTIARDRGYHDIVAVIEDAEQRRRQATSCPNAAVSPVQDQITAAIRVDDAAEAIRLLQVDESLIRACDRQGGTPLHVAAEAANEEMVAWLLNQRASVRKADLRGLTPLDRAALAADPRGHFCNALAPRFKAVAKLLLEHGAEVTIRAAVALADAPRVRELLAADRGVLRQIHWGSGGLLTLAVNHGHIEMVRLLLDLGADADERTVVQELEEPIPSWGTPLWQAAMAGRRDIAELLLDRGADPNANVYASGWPLRNAYQNRDDGMVRLLLDRGARPQPYMVGESNDAAEARRMLEADASEALAKELAESAAGNGCAAVLELALPRLNWPKDDRRWNWILIQPIRGMAASSPDHEAFFTCMEILLRHGIDANVCRRFGQTALHFAAARGGTERRPNLTEADRARFAAMLLDRGARLDLRDDLLQSTPLGWACRWGRTPLVKLLIARGAPVHEPGAPPWATPLAWANKMGHTEIAALLAS
ncbi:MAG TPA: ankyrin repeat domain-containing protein [Candidatus Acidoferrales bacterium]|jgi:ankyrin repeat protein|nr:ankyrin repeat domain-containing protein [Candidatus Acidoferrales bacterium]